VGGDDPGDLLGVVAMASIREHGIERQVPAGSARRRTSAFRKEY
jgi:hypothetical protein